jgi:hypothetical protein
MKGRQIMQQVWTDASSSSLRELVVIVFNIEIMLVLKFYPKRRCKLMMPYIDYKQAQAED